MAKPCRIFNLQLAVSLLADVVLDPEKCQEDASHLAIVAMDDEGLLIEITTPVCDFHEVLVSKSEGHVRSIRLRS